MNIRSRNRAVLIMTGLTLAMAAEAGAVSFTGATSAISGATIPGIVTGSNAWTTRGVRLDWTIDNTSNPGLWTYHYTFSPGANVNKGVDFFDIETAADLLTADITVVSNVARLAPGAAGTDAGQVTFDGVNLLTDQTSGNPGAPVAHDFTGARWSLPAAPVNDPTNFPATYFDLTFTSTRAPMWGDFFVFGDRTNNAPNTFASAHNSQIDTLTRLSLPPFDNLSGAAPYTGWVLVPGPLDLTTPVIASTAPANASGNGPINQPFKLIFSEGLGIDHGVITPAPGEFSFTGPGGEVAGTLSYDAATATVAFQPTVRLERNASYTATLGAPPITDLSGNPFAGGNTSWTFSTAPYDGDLDQTGNGVTVGDALRALRIAVNLVQPDANDAAHGDVAPLLDGTPNPDGAITVADALAILRKAVQLDTF